MTDTFRIAVIDDEPVVCREIKRFLERERWAVETFPEGRSALQRMRTHTFDLVLCDLRLPGIGGLEILREIKSKHKATEVIIMTGYGGVETAVDAIKGGAFHFVAKPVKGAEIRSLARRALEKVALVRERESLKQELLSACAPVRIVGSCEAMQEALRLVEKVGPLDCSVIVRGESGTGKELVARAIHARGPRADKPFVSFNCGGFSEELIANELFGHERGAFTGATERKVGLLESAHGGTVFLDEIGEMPASMQVKLLRFVQERVLLRVGGVKEVPVDVRVISASNQDLKVLVEKGTFRQDLFYRLNVVRVSLPPLRARTDDIALLASHFLAKYSSAFGKDVRKMEKATLDILLRYPFPGNVRELENMMERAVALADGPSVRPADLPSDLQELSMSSVNGGRWPTMEEKEREYIHQVLMETRQNRGLAAKVLGIPRTTLWRKMKKMGLA